VTQSTGAASHQLPRSIFISDAAGDAKCTPARKTWEATHPALALVSMNMTFSSRALASPSSIDTCNEAVRVQEA